MQVKEVVEAFGLKVFSGESGLENEIGGGYTSDVLSDAMGSAKAGAVWITLQAHINSMAVATLKEMAAVILVKNIEPESGVMEVSNAEGIPLLGTADGAFEISGKLYRMLENRTSEEKSKIGL